MDAAFATAKYPAYTINDLRQSIAAGRDPEGHMAAEVERRDRRDAGDRSVQTPSERLSAEAK